MVNFIWQAGNIQHVGKHNVAPDEAEYVVVHAAGPYPEYIGDGKFLVCGQTADGWWLAVIFVPAHKAAGVDWTAVDLTLVDDDSLFVIHARPLKPSEKSKVRKRLGI